MNKAGIYRITCLVTRSVYVGSSINYNTRLRAYTCTKLTKISDDIKESIQIYGMDNHEIKILCKFDSNIPRKELETYEDAFILLYLSRLGEDKMLNSKCNDTKKWVSVKMKKRFSEKSLCHNKLGINNDKSKKINQYTLNGVYIKTWDCMRDVYRFYDKEMSHISGCCRGKRNYAYGFKWTFYNENRDNSTIL